MTGFAQFVLGTLLLVALVASLASMGLYFKDKRAAQRGTWRTRERTLHAFSLAGGWPGAMLAQKLFRHKTRDQPFRMIFWGTVALHVVFVAMVLWLLFRTTSP